jgi:hypothetical protein
MKKARCRCDTGLIEMLVGFRPGHRRRGYTVWIFAGWSANGRVKHPSDMRLDRKKDMEGNLSCFVRGEISPPHLIRRRSSRKGSRKMSDRRKSRCAGDEDIPEMLGHSGIGKARSRGGGRSARHLAPIRGIIGGLDRDLYILVPIAAVVLTTLVLVPIVIFRASIRAINRRDDPRHQKLPPDVP